MISNYKKNTNYQILTPTGFKDFIGVKKTTTNVIKTIYFDNGQTVCGSLDHEIVLDNKPIKLKDIKHVRSSYKYGFHDVYTIQGVNGECYYIKELEQYEPIISKNCAYIPEKIFEEFYSSTYPTISSGEDTKIIITSTAKDVNHFYEIWNDALNGKNTYAPIEIKWSDVDGRDEAWKKRTIGDIGQKKFDREYGNEFFGRTSVVVPIQLLKSLLISTPLVEKDDLKIFEYPLKNKKYVAMVDIAEGKGDGDNSALVIIKLPDEQNKTEPNKVVFTFKSNTISIFYFIELVHSFINQYNEAFLIPEVNIHDIASTLYRDYEYVNIIKTSIRNQHIASSFDYKSIKLGVKTTTVIKKLGLESLIELFEQKLLDISDIDILKELTTLSKGKTSFEARPGYNDDLVICLVLFAWAIRESKFRELLDLEEKVSNELQENYVKQLYDDLPDFLIDRGEFC